MSDELVFSTFDVFTDRRFAGNPLAIVEDPDGLPVDAMQRIAREFNLSETIFVQAPEAEGQDARVRIFTPMNEIPFAGHPTIGCAIYLALRDNQRAGDFERVVNLKANAGLVPVAVARRAGRVVARLTAPVLPQKVSHEVIDRRLAAAALGIETQSVGFGNHAIGAWAGGPAFLYIPLASLEALARARPVEPDWSRLCAIAGTGSIYLYTAGGDADFRARMFAPASGIAEDPATGSASAILAAPLLAAGVLAEGTSRLRLEQGIEMGRPSQIGLEADVSDSALVAVRVSGCAVPVANGRIMAGTGDSPTAHALP